MSVGNSSKSVGVKITRAVVYAVFVVGLGGLVNVFWAMAARKFGFEGSLFQDVVSIILAVLTLLLAAFTCWLFWEGPNTRAKGHAEPAPSVRLRHRRRRARVAAHMLTIGGQPVLWPWKPKPPYWFQDVPILNEVWKPNGHTAYVVYALTYEGLRPFGIDLISLPA
ncbi:hypothetical protein ACFFGH_10775 [Lysobacter korlensis]|uniref:Uncharacterized protein n=1 Tax=Lysobacter korlensis TaxID=553636 RepID=A0ABV6RQV7_9GAMM